MKDKKEEIELTATTHSASGDRNDGDSGMSGAPTPQVQGYHVPDKPETGGEHNSNDESGQPVPDDPTVCPQLRNAPPPRKYLLRLFPLAPRKLTPGHCVVRRRRWSLRYRCIVCGRSFGAFARGGRRGLPLPEWFRWPWRRHPPPPPPSTPSERSSVLRTLPP